MACLKKDILELRSRQNEYCAAFDKPKAPQKEEKCGQKEADNLFIDLFWARTAEPAPLELQINGYPSIKNKKGGVVAFHSRLSLILCLLLSCQPPAFALKEPARDSARGGGARPAAAAVSIPENLGAVRERYEANSGGRTVILIEDAHADPAAQENIRRILRHLQTQHSLKWVGVEGASGRIDRSFFRTFPDQDLLEDVILGYVRGGELSGAAAAAILDPPETLFTGLEDWGLYERALEIYLQVKASPARSTVNFTDLSRKSSAHLLKPAEQSESSATKIRLEHLIKKTLQLDLSRKEWEEFKSTMASKETWLHTFPDFERISTELHPYIRFFQIAEERDEIFLKRALSLMEISRQQNAVVVCGRFHSEGMAQQLRASGISYMVITPHGTGGANEGLRYSRLLRGEVSWNHYFSTENGYVDLYEAFAQALRDKLLKAAGPKAAARILRVWRARLSQSAAPPGITERNNPLLSMPSYEQEPLPLHREWLLNIDSFIEHSAKLPGGRSHLQPAVMIPLGSDKLRSNLLVQIPLKQSE